MLLPSGLAGEDSQSSIKVGTRERTYRLYLPSAYTKHGLLPLVIVLHGGGSSGKQMISYTGFNKVAERELFIAVYPDGVEKHWNDGRGKSGYLAQREDIDDVGFISALIDRLSQAWPVDLSRVYVAGASNGAMMAYRLALELPERLAAAAAVIGNLGEQPASSAFPPKPIAILIINGTQDPLMPWEGGAITLGSRQLGKVLSTYDTVKFWVKHNQCSPAPQVYQLPDTEPKDRTRVKKEVYSGGAEGSEVVLYTIAGGGHTWPGAFQYLPESIIGRTCRDINATELIWQFFQKHRRENSKKVLPVK